MSATDVTFTVEIPVDGGSNTDPCLTAELTINNNNFVGSEVSTAVFQEAEMIEIDDNQDISSTVLDPSTCGPIAKEFWDVTNGVESALDPSVFFWTDYLTGTSLAI